MGWRLFMTRLHPPLVCSAESCLIKYPFIHGNADLQYIFAIPEANVVEVLKQLDGYGADVSDWTTDLHNPDFQGDKLNQIVLTVSYGPIGQPVRREFCLKS